MLVLIRGSMHTEYQEQQVVEVEVAEIVLEERSIVIFNDDVNTFEHVIDTLIKVCKHSPEQAEQCTLLVHYRGKCAVKSGELDMLKPIRDAICERGIDGKII